MKYDVVVVGSGASGSLVVDHFVKQGKTVCLLEYGQDGVYFPDNARSTWRGDTRVTELENGVLFCENTWADESRYQNPRAKIENIGSERRFAFLYNMKFGYGGSAAVWSGHSFRMLPSDFLTDTLANYGRDWPFTYEALVTYYNKVEEIFGVSGPQDNDDWPWENNFQSPAFKQSYLDSVVQRAVEPYFKLVPSAHAVKNAPSLDGGCIGARSCVAYCPSNALFRPYHHLIEPHRGKENLTTIFNAQVYAVIPGASGRIEQVRYFEAGVTRNVSGDYVFLCGNTIENIRILLTSEQVTNTPVANSSGLLGHYFSSHGAVQTTLVTTEPLYVGRGRPSTSVGVNTALEIDRSILNTYMLEVWSYNWTIGTGNTAFRDYRRETKHWGRTLFREAEVLNRQTTLSLVFELEMRASNMVRLSDRTDENGVPLAQVDFELGERDRLTFNEVSNYPSRFEANDIVEECRVERRGLNGNHPLGGYCCASDSRDGVIDEFMRSFDHDNLYILGGGAFNSTSCLNPTMTIAALTLKSLDDPRLE